MVPQVPESAPGMGRRDMVQQPSLNIISMIHLCEFQSNEIMTQREKWINRHHQGGLGKVCWRTAGVDARWLRR